MRTQSTNEVLSARAVAKAYGATVALSRGDFELRAGEVHALVGANGAGKSTMVRILSGLERADNGEVRFGADEQGAGEGAGQGGVGRSSKIPESSRRWTPAPM